MTADHFALRADGYVNGGTVTANVIGVIENSSTDPTPDSDAAGHKRRGAARPPNDVIRLALVERHRGTGEIVNGFVSGFGLNVPCAVAATVAHDSHHLVVMGTRESDMAQAVNTLADIGGGVIVVREGEVVALWNWRLVASCHRNGPTWLRQNRRRMVQAMIDCGCTLNNAYMQLSPAGAGRHPRTAHLGYGAGRCHPLPACAGACA